MTNVYGVTFIGGRDQILKQLRAFDYVPEPLLNDCAAYLTKLVFASLGQIFVNAQQIQHWFTAQAHKIAASGEPVAWITPLGLPVIQPYHKSVGKQVSAASRNCPCCLMAASYADKD